MNLRVDQKLPVPLQDSNVLPKGQPAIGWHKPLAPAQDEHAPSSSLQQLCRMQTAHITQHLPRAELVRSWGKPDLTIHAGESRPSLLPMHHDAKSPASSRRKLFDLPPSPLNTHMTTIFESTDEIIQSIQANVGQPNEFAMQTIMPLIQAQKVETAKMIASLGDQAHEQKKVLASCYSLNRRWVNDTLNAYDMRAVGFNAEVTVSERSSPTQETVIKLKEEKKRPSRYGVYDINLTHVGSQLREANINPREPIIHPYAGFEAQCNTLVRDQLEHYLDSDCMELYFYQSKTLANLVYETACELMDSILETAAGEKRLPSANELTTLLTKELTERLNKQYKFEEATVSAADDQTRLRTEQAHQYLQSLDRESLEDGLMLREFMSENNTELFRSQLAETMMRHIQRHDLHLNLSIRPVLTRSQSHDQIRSFN